MWLEKAMNIKSTSQSFGHKSPWLSPSSLQMSQSFGNNFHNSVRRVVKCSLKKQSRENQIPGFSGKRNKKTDSIQPHMAVSQIGELRSGCKEYFFSFDCRLSRKSLQILCKFLPYCADNVFDETKLLEMQNSFKLKLDWLSARRRQTVIICRNLCSQ